ncbi:MAG: DNA repair protein RadC [Alicyclobacillaceae bacterium]|jgi:DNA repair protein RadC|uniref:RadC family protein n=1 Tax=Alicyclobacillus sp. SP_1 TaxID=2942475 RepID=UPI0021587E47|nr:DNA repair protein RadC [Alicyclobacillus sp. SP_1]MCY0888915.1 DNA repair protein RadC [Alicyclobacillaceae bacterium]MCY0896333.1 DNA repair protein RadC [Alicyclobacillaceae bacterium]
MEEHALQHLSQVIRQAEDAPRERLLSKGPSALRGDELLAIILQTGSRNLTVFELAVRVVDAVGGIYGLLDARVEELMRIPGIGRGRALQLSAAVELGRRIASGPVGTRPVIHSADDAAALVMDRMRYLKKEHFVTFYLDTKHRILGEETSSVGSLDSSIVHPREIFMPAVRRSAAAILCIHNHPSGDPTPSPEDVSVTRRLCEAGRILGIDVLDHLVIGDGQFRSLKALNFM